METPRPTDAELDVFRLLNTSSAFATLAVARARNRQTASFMTRFCTESWREARNGPGNGETSTPSWMGGRVRQRRKQAM